MRAVSGYPGQVPRDTRRAYALAVSSDEGVSFEVAAMLAAFGRLWLHDHRCRSLVTVDLATARPSVAAELGPEPEPDLAALPTVPLPPRGVLATDSAIWLPCLRTPLRRIDPGSLTVDELDPLGSGWFAANADGLFGLSDRPDRVLTALDDHGQVRVRRDWRGHASVGAATAEHLWLVDRTTERLVRLAAHSLEPEWEHDFAGGEVTHLFASGDGVVAVHNRDLERGLLIGEKGFMNRSQVYRVAMTGAVTQVGEIGVGRLVAYDAATNRLWTGRSDHRRLRGHRGLLSALDLVTGTADHDQYRVPGQADRIEPAADAVWVAGFRPSGQRDQIWRLRRRAEPIGLTKLRLRFDPPTGTEPRGPRTSTELATVIRAQLAGRGERFDPRADRWVDAGPTIRGEFTLREVHVDTEAPRVTVTFGWAPEPGVVFGFDFDATWLAQENAYGPGLQAAPDNIWLFALEELDTGLMDRAPREVRDGVVWISTRG